MHSANSACMLAVLTSDIVTNTAAPGGIASRHSPSRSTNDLAKCDIEAMSCIWTHGSGRCPDCLLARGLRVGDRVQEIIRGFNFNLVDPFSARSNKRLLGDDLLLSAYCRLLETFRFFGPSARNYGTIS